MRKYAGAKPPLLITAQPPQFLNDTITRTIAGTENNLAALAELSSSLSEIDGVPNCVFDQVCVLRHTMEEVLALNRSALSARASPNGSVASLTGLLQEQYDDFRRTNPACRVQIVPIPAEIEEQASNLEADIMRECMKACMLRAASVGAAGAVITIECRSATQAEIYDLPCTLRGCDCDAVTPRIHVNAAAPAVIYLFVQCTTPIDETDDTAQTNLSSPALSVQDEEMDALTSLVRSGSGFCGELSGFAAPLPSTVCVWFALPFSLSAARPHMPSIPAGMTTSLESLAGKEMILGIGQEDENRIQRLRSLSSEEDPNAHRILTRAALDADSPAHRALRSSLTAALQPSHASVEDSNYHPAPFFDPLEAARFRTAGPFPAYKKRLSRQSLMVAVNAAFPTPRNDSPSVTPVSRWTAVPGKVTEGGFDSSGSTDPGMSGMAGLSVKGKESPKSVPGSVSVNPFALPGTAAAESPALPAESSR